MEYHFKIGQEVAWAFAIGAFTAFIQIAVTFDPATVTEWGVWAAASGAAVLRAGAAMTLPALLRIGKKVLNR
ncbi:hypothetical protein LCGC14_2092970 [marine sediment metagenome]|uniref:Uncharacterized protein n=1 Tax=marine sediment metagenome TaxID=412755 RepID=A0A0F9EZI7_9ZZZZ